MKSGTKKIAVLTGAFSFFMATSNCRDLSGILKDETAPTIDSATVAGSSSASDRITLTWNAASDNKAAASEINYELCISQTANGCANFAVTATTSPGATQYTFIGLAEATIYYIRIRPRDNAGNVGAASADIQVITALVPAGAPVFGVAPGSYNSGQSVSITSSTSGAIICYTVDLATPACNATPACTTGTQIANGNSAAVNSNLTLKAIACKLNKLDTAVISGNYVIDSTPPTVPGSPTATPISISQIDLSWAASSDAQTAQANIVYEICQTTTSTACNGGGFAATYTTAPGATAYSVNTGLATLTTYYFVIRAKDSLANVNPTAQISATTLAAGTVSTPTFSPVAGAYGSTQNATPSTSTGGAIVCYKTGSAPGACTAGPTCAAGSTQFSSAVAIASTTTLYAVGCKTGFTQSTTGSALYTIDTAAPTTPGSFTATAASSSQINLSWTASSDDTTATGSIVYEICKTTTSGGCGTFSATLTTAAGATAYNDSGLNPLTNYYYVIRARDSFSKYSTPSAEQTGTTQSLGTVNAPTFSPVAGTYGTTQNVTPSTSTSGAIVCYKIGSAPGACTAGPTCAAGSTQFSSSVSVASTSTMYAAGCKTGYTDSSAAVVVYTIDTAAPSTPGSFTATTASASQINLTWTASSDDTTAVGSIAYEICRSTSSGGCSTFNATITTAAGATSYNDTGCALATRYYYAIRAKDSFNKTGSASSESTATTAPSDGTNWTQIKTGAPWGVGRAEGISHGGKLWIFGGWSGVAFRDVWSSPDGNSWTQITTSAAWPATDHHAKVSFNGEMWVLAGKQAGVWSSTDGITWTNRAASTAFSNRWDGCAVNFNGKIWFMGGYSTFNAVYSSPDGITWTSHGNASWPGRGHHACVVYNGKVYVIGGFTGSYKSDVWSSPDGLTWTEETASASFGARYTEAVVYDNKIWVLGGATASSMSNQVYTSTDGVNWTLVSTITPFAARGNHIADVMNGRMFIFAGANGTGLTDVWQSNLPGE